jgi:citrate lyase subunit beta/citryl-CoA lyase
MPKIDHPTELESLSARLDALEGQRGLAPKAVGVVALIESPRALERLTAIADSPRVIGLALGGEDFALSLGRPPTPHALGFAAQAIAYSASARQLMGIGMTCGIADFSNLEAFAADAQRSFAIGLTGAMCIHPSQVPVLNTCFGHSEAEIIEARAILAAWRARVDGVVSHEGRMIDEPVAERARRLLKRAGVV